MVMVMEEGGRGLWVEEGGWVVGVGGGWRGREVSGCRAGWT